MTGPALRRAEWHIITCEYPPQHGGVSDYTRIVAAGLASHGDRVHVWAPRVAGERPFDEGVAVHDDAGSFSRAGLRRLDASLDRFSNRRLLIQWVPHGFGYRSMNVAFCLWLLRRARKHGDTIEIMVHEASLPFRASATIENGIALVHRLMTAILLRAASHVWYAIPAWERRWRPYALGRRVPFTWLPIPSNIPTNVEPARVDAIRRRYAGSGILLGHFGTFGPEIRKLLLEVITSIPPDVPRFDVLLIGPGSTDTAEAIERERPDLQGRVHTTGRLPGARVAEHIASCDVMLQPYPDGVSCRRGSFMAALALGRASVTTLGELSEPFWKETGAALCASPTDIAGLVGAVQVLVSDERRRQRVGEAARALYAERFDAAHTIARLRAPR